MNNTCLLIETKMNVVLVSHSLLYMEVLQLWIDRIEDMIIIGKFSSQEEFCKIRTERRPDILIIDFYKELNSDMNFLKKMSKKFRGMKILVVSMYNDMSFHIALKKCGVKGCIEKYNINSDLELAIHNLHKGRAHFLTG